MLGTICTKRQNKMNGQYVQYHSLAANIEVMIRPATHYVYNGYPATTEYLKIHFTLVC